MKLNTHDLAWEKMNGLIPAIVQDANTGRVLMLGFMNEAALQKTVETNYVTFYSRSRNALWMKGETSGNKLALVDIFPDCDQDTLLITAHPSGVICHTGSTTCFGESAESDWRFIQDLETLIKEREQTPVENSYTAKLLESGVSRMAQKVGEEGVEVALAAIEKNDDGLCAEVADLFFHVLVLLRARKINLTQVIAVLKERRQPS